LPRVVPGAAGGADAEVGVAGMSVLTGLVVSLRPRQWLKNVLVFAAPAAAGVITHGHTLEYTGAAFAVFCLAASGTYLVNDVLDREADRVHPTKRLRPIAAGVVPPATAIAVAVVLLAAALGGSAAIGRPKLAITVACYVVVTLAYSAWLKHEPVLDLGAVAAGFVLRAIAGGVAAQIPLSNWFLIVACFGSLFMVTGKREAEVMLLGDDGGEHRATLDSYTPSFLRYVRSVSSGVAMTGYCLWAFEKATGSGAIWFELSIVPFVLAVLRYGLLVDAGHGGAPEDVVLGDRTLQILGVCLLALFAVGVYH
jgi:decaprenyl-phosphate phosphoribosyltransferase